MQIGGSYLRVCLRGEAYIGQTHQEFHGRLNGHRSNFKVNGALEYEKGALSFHAFLKHRTKNKGQFDLNIFKVGVIRRAIATELDRTEDYYINLFNTRLSGLNRIVVVR